MQKVRTGCGVPDEGRYGDWCQTHITMTKFYPLDPRAEEIHLLDIARSNSRMDRFNGHHNWPDYTVGQHEILIAWALQAAGYPPEVCITGLFHDGAEAYLPDLPRPIKRYAWLMGKNGLMKWTEAEDEILALFPQVIPGFLWPMPAIVKEYDDRMLLAESSNNTVINRTANWCFPTGMEPLYGAGEIQPWTPEVVESIFLDTHFRLQLALTGGIPEQIKPTQFIVSSASGTGAVPAQD